ncbi:SDR family NAD(P)-dependent oxidoreductase [Craurococcus roseus]
MGSVSWRRATGGMPAYVTAKAGMERLTRGLARDLGPAGVRVSAVIPGWIMTERQRSLWVAPAAEANLLKGQCLKRAMRPDDVARVALFLASRASGSRTAQSFVVDGGDVTPPPPAARPPRGQRRPRSPSGVAPAACGARRSTRAP